MLIVFKDIKYLHVLKDLFQTWFEMKDVRSARRILDMNVKRNRDK